jgi:hypothetical protein
MEPGGSSQKPEQPGRAWAVHWRTVAGAFRNEDRILVARSITERLVLGFSG